MIVHYNYDSIFHNLTAAPTLGIATVIECPIFIVPPLLKSLYPQPLNVSSNATTCPHSLLLPLFSVHLMCTPHPPIWLLLPLFPSPSVAPPCYTLLIFPSTLSSPPPVFFLFYFFTFLHLSPSL